MNLIQAARQFAGSCVRPVTQHCLQMLFNIVTKRLYVTDINIVPVTDSKPGSLNIHTQNLEMKAVHPNTSRNVAMTLERMLEVNKNLIL